MNAEDFKASQTFGKSQAKNFVQHIDDCIYAEICDHKKINQGETKKMSVDIQFARSSDSPVFAGNIRFLLGLLLMFIGLYMGLFADFQGHAFGFLLIFASPFVIFKDDDNLKERNF